MGRWQARGKDPEQEESDRLFGDDSERDFNRNRTQSNQDTHHRQISCTRSTYEYSSPPPQKHRTGQVPSKGRSYGEWLLVLNFHSFPFFLSRFFFFLVPDFFLSPAPNIGMRKHPRYFAFSSVKFRKSGTISCFSCFLSQKNEEHPENKLFDKERRWLTAA